MDDVNDIQRGWRGSSRYDKTSTAHARHRACVWCALAHRRRCCHFPFFYSRRAAATSQNTIAENLRASVFSPESHAH